MNWTNEAVSATIDVVIADAYRSLSNGLTADTRVTRKTDREPRTHQADSLSYSANPVIMPMPGSFVDQAGTDDEELQMESGGEETTSECSVAMTAAGNG